MSTTPRKRLTAQERRAAILDSALAVFAGRGYHVASIDDIAREGSVSKALIYEHFASKQELFTVAMSNRGIATPDFITAITTLDASADPRESRLVVARRLALACCAPTRSLRSDYFDRNAVGGR